MYLYLFFLVSFSLSLFSQSTNTPLFQFAVVADCQYCDQPTNRDRNYRSSLTHLKNCIKQCNTQDLKYLVHLGDFIDKDYKSFAPLLELSSQLKAPLYHVLGNHDFSVDDNLKASVPKLLKMPSRYYSFQVQDWKFIVIDGNDVSLHAYAKASPQHKQSMKIYKSMYSKLPGYNGAIGDTQLQWIKDQLRESE
jgi:manganese-dependent ADP-ribose/CDP-alcohol diphosphatase